MNTIKQKIGRGLAGFALATGLAGIVAGTSGCTTEGNAFGQGLVRGGIVTGVGAFASGMGNEAGRQAAGGGPTGTNVNIYNGSGQQQYVSQQKVQLPMNVIRTGETKYEPAQGYKWMNPSDRNDLRVMPLQVIQVGENKYEPVPGYKWINPSDRNDLRVIKQKSNYVIK